MMYNLKPLHEKIVYINCLMGLIFSTSWRIAPTIVKIPRVIWIF